MLLLLYSHSPKAIEDVGFDKIGTVMVLVIVMERGIVIDIVIAKTVLGLMTRQRPSHHLFLPLSLMFLHLLLLLLLLQLLLLPLLLIQVLVVVMVEHG